MAVAEKGTDTLARPDIPALVRDATDAGVTFRLRGAKVLIENSQLADPAVFAALREQRDVLWAYLGGRNLDRPSLDVMAKYFPEISIVVPQDGAEALEVIAQIEADADRHANGLLGLDIETQASGDEEIRQPVRIGRNGVVTQQPALDPPHLRSSTRKTSTAGLDPLRSTVRLAQFYGGGDTCLVLDTGLVVLNLLAPVLGRRKAVIHNAAFELSLLHHAGIDLSAFECTMHAAGLLLGVHRRSLEDAALHFLNIILPKDLQTSDWGAPVLSAGQLAYAALDAVMALKMWPLLRAGLIRQGRVGAYLLQREAIAPTVRMQRRGVWLNREAHQKQIDRWAIAHADARHAFTKHTGVAPPETPAQIRQLLQKTLPPDALKDWPRTKKTGELSTSDRHLKRHWHVAAIRQVSAIQAQEKLLSSFGATLAARTDDHGRLHAGFNLAGAKTGRMSSSNPNMQQMPRDPEFRNCFVAAPGRVLVVGDYSAMELRAAAEISNDAVLRRDFADGVDLHRQVAAQIHGIPYDQITRDQRQAAKPISFGTIYGAGGNGLAASAWASYGVVMTPREAQEARDQFLRRYFGLARWMRTNAELCQRRGYIAIGRYGRVIRAEWEATPAYKHGCYRHDDEDADDRNEDDDGTDLEVEVDVDYGRNWQPQQRVVSQLKYTLCCNAPIQGACADITMRAMILVDRTLRDAGIGGGLVLAVHDELVLEVPEHQGDEAAGLLERAMTRAFVKYFPKAPVNGLVKARIVRAWGEAKS